ncbi:hypothetical protein VKT23_001515 [Stygiomarasmius scandens]|uniref:DUF8040 domain-containing protein n=1 Tax=Marasmiellus scandens TaxID=2682957 RepID=A0ABR1K201_9AGAR
MVCTHPSSPRRQSSCIPTHLSHDKQKQCAFIAVVALIALVGALMVINNTWNCLNPEPYHMSRLSGREWVEELELGHWDCMRNSLGFRPTLFQKLEKELIEKGGLALRQWIDMTEQLTIFLYQATTNSSVRKTAERFQRSFETISNATHSGNLVEYDWPPA